MRGRFLFPLLWITAFARSTGSHKYGADEYVTLSAGLSPDGKLAITAHGCGDHDGYVGFHLYLTDARTGKKLGLLREVAGCAEGVFAASWAATMSAVTIDLPDSLHRKLRDFAAAEGTSVERLVASAAAEKLAAMMEGAEFLRREGARASRAEYERVLARAPRSAPQSHDALDQGGCEGGPFTAG